MWNSSIIDRLDAKINDLERGELSSRDLARWIDFNAMLRILGGTSL
ncbi:hypothetical protein ACFL2Q_02615 [Thermodesulfobacteriota bacterium]